MLGYETAVPAYYGNSWNSWTAKDYRVESITNWLIQETVYQRPCITIATRARPIDSVRI
jgi:hypothetical protein